MHVLAIYLAALCAITCAQVEYGGYTLNNERLSNDNLITTESATSLRQKWRLAVSGDVTATAAIINVNGITTAFFPDWYEILSNADN
jgi:hypothetical protein